MMHLWETKKDSTLLYDGKIIQLYKDTVTLENNTDATREYIHHSGGVSIAALTPEEEIYLVKQFRYPYHKVVLELPAGKRNEGEDPLACGKRELEEEVGLIAAKYTSLGQLYPTPAYVDEIIHLYLAEDLSPTKPHLDPDEFLDVVKLPLREAVQMVLRGEICDAKTQTGLLKLWVLRHDTV